MSNILRIVVFAVALIAGYLQAEPWIDTRDANLRADIEHKNNLIPAKVENVSSAVLCTSLKNESLPLSDFLSTNPSSAPVEFNSLSVSFFA